MTGGLWPCLEIGEQYERQTVHQIRQHARAYRLSGKVTQWVKARATKTGGPSSTVPRTHKVEGGAGLCRQSSDLHTCATVCMPHPNK